MYLGDYDAATVIYGKFTTYRPSTGATFTLAGTPALSVYKDNSTTQSTTGVTLTADFDTVTGLNHFTIDTSADGTFYAAGSNFDIVITTGTVDSVSVVGSVVGTFSLRKNSSLKPTTGGRTLDVSATGEGGVDWANIGSPTTSVNLSGTTVGTATALGTGAVTAAAIADGAIDRATFAADTGMQTIRSNTAQAGAAGSITLDAAASATNDYYVGARIYLTGGTGVGQARVCTAYDGTTKVATTAPNWATNPDGTSTFAIIPAGQITGVQGNVTGSVGSVTGAVGSVTGNVGGNVVGSVGSVTGAVGSVTGAVGSVTGNVGGNVVGSVASVTAGVTVTTNNDKTGYALSTAGNAAVADKLLGRNLAGGADGTRTVQDALRVLRNKVTIAAGTLTVTAEDDTTSAWTAAVSTTAGNPISQIDPA